VRAIIEYRRNEFSENLQDSHLREGLSPKKLVRIFGMYLKFLAVYVIVMIITYYGVQTLGVLRFVRRKRGPAPGNALFKFLKAAGRGIAYIILFSPAYVIAYSIRTEFNTDTLFFMILLAVASNGLLMMYANKFYAFLVAESRRGYVETAIVKNLNRSYSQKSRHGIPFGAMLRPVKRFDRHVFGHIYRNARFQYFSTIKEQACFLITGLIIIEMALNIHGHLSYEMLRQILYGNLDIVIVIVLGIFYTVKLTEILVDARMHREKAKYENR
jgi:hypothetical protein